MNLMGHNQTLTGHTQTLTGHREYFQLAMYSVFPLRFGEFLLQKLWLKGWAKVALGKWSLFLTFPMKMCGLGLNHVPTKSGYMRSLLVEYWFELFVGLFVCLFVFHFCGLVMLKIFMKRNFSFHCCGDSFM